MVVVNIGLGCPPKKLNMRTKWRKEVGEAIEDNVEDTDGNRACGVLKMMKTMMRSTILMRVL